MSTLVVPVDTIYSIVSEVIEVSLDSAISSSALNDAYGLYDSALNKIIMIACGIIAIKFAIDILGVKYYIKIKLKEMDDKIKKQIQEIEEKNNRYQKDFFYQQIEYNNRFCGEFYKANGNKCNIMSYRYSVDSLNYLVKLDVDYRWFHLLLPVIVGIENNYKSASEDNYSFVMKYLKEIQKKLKQNDCIDDDEKNKVIKDIDELGNVMGFTRLGKKNTNYSNKARNANTEGNAGDGDDSEAGDANADENAGDGGGAGDANADENVGDGSEAGNANADENAGEGGEAGNANKKDENL